jgi:hypothetical protein
MKILYGLIRYLFFNFYLSCHLRVAVARSQKLLAEAGENSVTQSKGERPPLEAATKQRLVKSEKSLWVLYLSLEYITQRDNCSYL